MSLFGSKKGGLMDVIRCDEDPYLVWKWRPKGQAANSTNKENSVRWGSSLRVKESEVAVFVYKQKDGTVQDFIEGPFDQTIKTANLPVLTPIIGLAYAGGSPFQAEIYFINLARIIQIKFGIPYFNIFDPRFPNFGVHVAVRGTITFRIADYREFIKLRRLVDFDLEALKSQIQDAARNYVKNAVANAPKEHGIPVIQIETRIGEINELVQNRLQSRLQNEFGILVSSVDIGAIEIDMESGGWNQLKAVTIDIDTKNAEDMQRINMKGAEMQVEGANFAVHQLNQQADVAKTAAASLGQMGQGGGLGGGDGFNPAGMMAGMAMGGAVGGQMVGMMNTMMHGIQQPGMAPPGTPSPPPAAQYSVAVNGQVTGPFNVQQLAQMAQSGQFDRQSLVWKQGMEDWTAAGTIAELAEVFSLVPPPPPPQ